MYRTMLNNYTFPCGMIMFKQGHVVKLLSDCPDSDGDVRVQGSASKNPYYCRYIDIIESSTDFVTEKGVEAYESN